MSNMYQMKKECAESGHHPIHFDIQPPDWLSVFFLAFFFAPVFFCSLREQLLHLLVFELPKCFASRLDHVAHLPGGDRQGKQPSQRFGHFFVRQAGGQKAHQTAHSQTASAPDEPPPLIKGGDSGAGRQRVLSPSKVLVR
jgi:hypothetical protein